MAKKDDQKTPDEVIAPTDEPATPPTPPADEKPNDDKPPVELAEAPVLDDRKAHKIVIIKATSMLKEGEEKSVSGSVASQLIKLGIAKLV